MRKGGDLDLALAAVVQGDAQLAVRRPAFEQFDLNLAKTFRITEKMRFQFRAEAYNIFNTPMYDERTYTTDPNSTEFGSINKATNGQSNFPRFWQLGFKFLF